MDDHELDSRLTALVARAPAGRGRPTVRRTRRVRLGLATWAAAVLVVGVAATASGAAEAVRQAVIGYPGVENPGQPLHGARLECMSPPEAEAFLEARGFVDVAWQVESGATKGGTTVVESTAPAHGYVVPAAIDRDGVLHIVVDQRLGAQPAGECGAMAMP